MEENNRNPKGAGRKPGTPKTGGRVAGVPNKKQNIVREYFALKEVDVIEELMTCVHAIESPAEKAKVYLELLKYVQPSYKPVDIIEYEKFRMEQLKQVATSEPLKEISTDDLINAIKTNQTP